jgi:hypothetical protein
MTLEELLYDVVVRVPNIQIVSLGDSYYLLDENKKVNISKSWIGYMKVLGYAKTNSHGGLYITEEGINLAHNIQLEKVKVESKKSPGHFFDAHISPRKFYDT